MIEIKNRLTGKVLKVVEGETLSRADLSGAYLSGADLRGAYLSGAYLRGEYEGKTVQMNWESHDLISFLLMLDAGKDMEKRKVAGLILVSRDMCWDDFAKLNDPLAPWVIDTLAKWVTGGDNAPKILQAAADKLKAVKGAEAPVAETEAIPA